MGVLYSVFPLNSKLAACLRESETAVPKKLPPSRMPTPAELRCVAKSIPKVNATMVTNGALLGQIDLATIGNPATGPWALINILKNTGDDEPCDFYFEKGWPNLIVEFLVRLTGTTGPLVLVPDTGEMPLLIEPRTKVDEVLRRWNERDA